MIRKSVPDLLRCLLLLLLPLLIFAPVALGSRTLLPADSLFLFEPYASAAPRFGIDYPQNHLVSDLILENYAWKRFVVEAVRQRQLPLWDPFIFAGHPFLANGQHSALYPLSFIFYVLPLWRAFGLFVWLQLGLAGIFTYLFARVLRIDRLGSLIAGITFQFSGFLIVAASAHPMIVAGASWLPFILAMVELLIRQRPALGGRPATLPWAVLGAVGLGCQMLVGHAENTYFVLLVTGLYALWRLVQHALARAGRGEGWIDGVRALRRPVLWLVLMVLLGGALGAVQFVPLVEVVNTSFRGGEAAATFQQVLGWAYPKRRLLTFAIPNFFGNPAHHGYFDLFTWRWTLAQRFPDGRYIDWGIKNYVEGGAYLGLLPLFLAAIGVLTRRPSERGGGALGSPKHYFTALSLFSLGCVFGTPLYAIVYALPLLKQSHSPFRWVFPLTLSVAVLAGFGMDVVQKRRAEERARRNHASLMKLFLLKAPFSAISLLAALTIWGGLATLAGLLFSRLFFARIEPLVERVFLSLAKAPSAFVDHRAFYSYEFKWIAIFGLLLTATGIVLRLSRSRGVSIANRPLWPYLAVGLLVVDMLTFGIGFNPVVDPALLDYVPPAVTSLKEDQTLWRYASFTPSGTTKTMKANTGMFYDLQCVAGYDSLFTRRYADYMTLIEPQGQLAYNRIAPFHRRASLDSPLTDLLNVKYVITEVEIDSPKYVLRYADEAVRIYENLGAMPRAYTMGLQSTLETANLAETAQAYDLRSYVTLDPAENPLGEAPAAPGTSTPQPVTGYTINEVTIDVQNDEPRWLILTDAYFPGWKAFIRPQGADVEEEQAAAIHRVNGIFRGVVLEEPGAWTVRLKYSPNSVKVGAFFSFIAGMVILFLVGLYLWRFFYREEDDATTVKRVAKNSVAPIILNLFNRAIDMTFAALMARILGPVGTGRYFAAVIIFGWFDIIANFGLETYLIRESAQDQANTRRLFINTTIVRLGLFGLLIPGLFLFLAGRQAVATPLDRSTLWTVALLYLGLLPGTISNNYTALFRACEQHEYPAAIQTATTMVKVTLGSLVLVGGWGIVGLAGASILTNLVTLTILAVLARRLIWPDLPGRRAGLSWSLQRTMLIASWPWMASLLLQALFPGINGLLLQSIQGNRVAGWYDAARKWLDALNVVPAFFTVAVLPLMSRQAAEDRRGLRRTYGLSVKLLVIVALPVAVTVTLAAGVLVGMLSGADFLPDGAIVLRILIWSILFGWINSLTNYVLMALDRQRYVLVASAARVVFTIVANLLFVPAFSYAASAWIMIAGECLLVILFSADLQRRIGVMHWGRRLWQPTVAAALMAGAALALSRGSLALALIASLAVYPLALILLGALSREERALLAPLIPGWLRKSWLGRLLPQTDQ